MEGKIVAICYSGGEFMSNNDGSMTYRGGEAHAVEVDRDMAFTEFKAEVAELCQYDICDLSIKYFLPHNKRIPITVSTDKCLRRMVDFHKKSETLDVYVSGKSAGNVTNVVVNNSSSRTTVDSVTPDATIGVANDDVSQPSLSGPLTIGATIIAATNDRRQHRLSDSWDGLITGVGQEFEDVNEFRRVLCKYAIAKGFTYKHVLTDRRRVTVKCEDKSCPWRLHASKLPTFQKFMIKTMNTVHTCNLGKIDPRATAKWVEEVLKDKLLDSPQYTPKEIQHDLYQDYGVKINYAKAWRVKERLRWSQLERFNELPLLCEKIMETNPGSLATLATTDDSRFRYFFVSFQAAKHGFEHGCRSLLFLNSIPLSKYQGILLAAIAVDGDDGIFPVAFAVVEAETHDSWNWFLVQLKSVVSEAHTITFLSSKHHDLSEAVPRVFEGSYHGYCINHLMEDFKKDFIGSQGLKGLILDKLKFAACTCKVGDFHDCIDSIKEFSSDGAAWVLASEPEKWSNAFFKGFRCDQFSLNIGDLFNDWVPEENELSIVQIIHLIQHKTMEVFCARREASSTWSTTLTPSMEEKLQKEISRSRSFKVFFTTKSAFEVHDGSLVEIVNIETWECTCGGWQISGLPCRHAIAVFSSTGRSAYDYCSKYLTVNYYRRTYSEAINQVPGLVDNPANGDSNPSTIIYPPKPCRRPPGRPKKKNMGLQKIGTRTVRCTKCKVFGHTVKTCKAVEL